MSSYAYTQELMNADESHTETTKLVNGDANNGEAQAVIQKSNSKMALNENGNVELVNGDVQANGINKPENIEMSTSTTSIKCCNGIFKKNNTKKKIVKEVPQLNGNSNGKCFYDSFKEKFSNGKCKDENKIKKEKIKKEIVFENRDPNQVNSSIVNFEYENVFAEPNEGTYSFNPTWSFTNKVYFHVKLFIYRLLAILIGIPAAFICAVFFALFSVTQIWILCPIIRLFKAVFGIFKELWATVIDALLGPIFQSFSQYKYAAANNQNINMV